MSKKSRGTNAERDLVHKFWGEGWACFRAAGSGSTQFPSPDIIAGNKIRKLAIEVKLTTEEKKYFTSEEINGLEYFSEKFGAEPWVAVKFYRQEWVFLTVEDLQSSGKNFVVTKELSTRRGLSFEDLTNI